jgi:hypothetical protein
MQFQRRYRAEGGREGGIPDVAFGSEKGERIMKKAILVIAALAVWVASSGVSEARGAQEKSARLGLAARIDIVHTAILDIAAAKGLSVTKDVRFATAYCVAVKSGGDETKVCLYQDKNRTDARIHGESQADVDALADAVRGRF